MRERSLTTVALALVIAGVGGTPHAERAPAFSDRTQAPSSSAREAPSLITSSGRVSPVATSATPQDQRSAQFPIELRPSTLADVIDSLAGNFVRLSFARVVGVFDPRVFLVESQTRLRPLAGNRNRVLVFIESGALRVPAALLVGSSVTVSGTARTLLSMQVSREVPWPAALGRDSLERLDIRAALLATSVRTPEGVDLVLGERTRMSERHCP